jgi:queuine tRNA-ribosyltransferase
MAFLSFEPLLEDILLSHHNLTYYQRLLADARAAITEDRFIPFYNSRLAGWNV